MAIAALALMPGAVLGQQDGAATQRTDAMRKLDAWVGDWQGTGWSVSADGRRTEFSIGETVQRRAGGAVLLVTGQGRVRAGGADSVVHDGVTVVSYDEKAKRYRWSGHELGSGPIEAEAKLIDGGLQWSLLPDTRGTEIRFTILLDGNRWRETAEASVGGGPWSKFMEVVLARMEKPR